MIDVAFGLAGFFFGLSIHSLVSAHKFKKTIVALKGTTVSVVTTKGERQFTLALDLSTSDEYAILQTTANENSGPVTFAVKSDKIKL